jgi:hypothetical protein
MLMLCTEGTTRTNTATGSVYECIGRFICPHCGQQDKGASAPFFVAVAWFDWPAEWADSSFTYNAYSYIRL